MRKVSRCVALAVWVGSYRMQALDKGWQVMNLGKLEAAVGDLGRLAGAAAVRLLLSTQAILRTLKGLTEQGLLS